MTHALRCKYMGALQYFDVKKNANNIAYEKTRFVAYFVIFIRNPPYVMNTVDTLEKSDSNTRT